MKRIDKKIWELICIIGGGLLVVLIVPVILVIALIGYVQEKSKKK